MAGSAAQRGFLTVLKVITWIVYVIAFAATILLAFGFALAMFNANPAVPFAAFVYKWSARFMGPFVGMIPSTRLANGGYIVWNALVAVFAYAVVAWLIGMALNAVSRRLNVERAAVAPRSPAPSPPASGASSQPAPPAQPATTGGPDAPDAPAEPAPPVQPAAPAQSPTVKQPGPPDAQ